MNYKYDKRYESVVDMIINMIVIYVFDYVFVIQYTTKRLSVTFDLFKKDEGEWCDDNNKIYGRGFFSKGFDAYLDNLVKLRGATHE